MTNPLLEAFRNEGHSWSGRLLDVLQDFETRLQTLGSDPGDTPVSYHDTVAAEYLPGNGGDESEGGTESDPGSVPE